MAISLRNGATLILLAASLCGKSYGQDINNYTFTGTTVTYTSVTGTLIANGGAVGGVDDIVYADLPIGFDFWYMGQRYTRFSVSANGWLTLGSVITGSAPIDNLLNGGTRPVIAPLWDDLAVFPGVAATGILPGDMRYALSGAVGSRTLTIQWASMRWNRLSSALGLPSSVMSFQVRLSENGNVQFNYQRDGGTVNSGSASIGITGVNGIYRSLNGTGAAPTASATLITDNLSTRPASNQAYTFDPQELAAPSDLYFTSIGSTGLMLNWTDKSSGEIGFVIYRSTDGGNVFNYLTTTAANATSYQDVGLSNSNTYYYRVFALRENLSSGFASGSQQTSCNSFAIGTSPNLNGASNNGPVCAGSALTLSVNTVDGASYSWVGPNNFSSALQNPTVTYTDAAKGTYTVTVTRNGCSATANTTVTSTGDGRWTGITSSNWNTASNWCSGVVPSQSTNVIIPSGSITSDPIIAANSSANHIEIQSGRTLTIASGGTLQVYGNITASNNIIAAAGKLALKGGLAQTINANTFYQNTLFNLEMDNGLGVTLQGPLRLTGTLMVLTGIFNVNGFLTLAASELGSANVAAINTGAAVQGQVQVERFVKGGNVNPYRTYRMFSSPVYDNTINFINTNVEGNRSAKFAQLIDDVIVSGPGGTANGFDATTNNSSSVWTYNAGFVGVPNITTAVNAGKGMYLFFRGNRSNFNGKTNLPYANPEDTIVDFEGILNQGDVSVSLPAGLSLLGNPYAATIDWDAASWGADKGNVMNAIWMWNPATRSYATYSNGVGLLGGSRYIPSGQSFFIESTTASSFKFKESVKASALGTPVAVMSTSSRAVASSGANSIATPVNELIRIGMKPLASYGEDETVIAFKNGAAVGYTAEDVPHIDGEVVNLSSVVGHQKLAINFMPPPLVETTIPLQVNSNASGAFLLQFTLGEPQQYGGLWLKDNHLGTVKPITNGQSYQFHIDKSIAATFGGTRFSILISPVTVLPIDLTDFRAKKQQDGVLLSWVSSTQNVNSVLKLYRGGENNTFTLIATLSGEVAKFLDAFPAIGKNYYQLVLEDDKGRALKTMVTVIDFNPLESSMVSFFPNPVRDKLLIKSDVLTGAFNVKLMDVTGKVIKELPCSGWAFKDGLVVDFFGLANGVYLIIIENLRVNEIRITQKVVKQ